jgi:hypothetical protein
LSGAFINQTSSSTAHSALRSSSPATAVSDSGKVTLTSKRA